MNNEDNLQKIDSKAHEGSNTSKHIQVYNKSTHVVKESMHMIFNVSNVLLKNCECLDHSIEICLLK